MKSKMNIIIVPIIVAIILISGCAVGVKQVPEVADQQEEEMFKLTSEAFTSGGEMSERYTYKLGSQCSGENYSPALNWEGAPERTKSFALTMIDPDGGNWVHWLLLNIPADTSSLPEVVGGPEIGIAGSNSFGKNGYGGPCPPSGTHLYIFTLYALDTPLEAAHGITFKSAQELFKNHILAKCELTGLRSRK